MPAVVPILDPAVVAAFRTGTLAAEQAEAALPRDRAAAVFFLLPLSLTLATPAPAGGAHTPSGTVPPYAKPAATGRRKKRGGKPGHPGAARPQTEPIDRRETHPRPACPDCGGTRPRTGRPRPRLVEDIPDDLRPEVTEHPLHRDWCPCCHQQVEPRVPDALPNGTLGNRTVVLSAWRHDGLGGTPRQLVDVFRGPLSLPLTDGGLTQMWHRLARVLTPWYEQIHRHCLDAGVLHADETGGRVEGRTWWLWCVTHADATYYLIDESRGPPALDQFFVEAFRGVLVTAFWAAYDAVGRAKQKCWPHLRRELKEVDKGSDAGGDWPDFAKRLRRIYGDAVRRELTRGAKPSDAYGRKLARLHGRIVALSVGVWTNPHARRLAERRYKYGDELLTSVEFEGVPSSNNHAEREVRPAVLMRKARFGSQSERGAATRAVLMSVCRTLKNRGLDPLQAILDALRTYAATGALPPLPEEASSGG
ncbi:MAG: IS66 family transposase [Gemmatimonadales bacterium]|nr:IS66 family transposase [Gemmatimonadales bacterium]